MTDAAPPRPVAAIASYHAHVYFGDAAERETAAWLRERVNERFSLRIGRWHDRPVGPHLKPMYQLAFAVALFPQLVPWLMLNRRGLSVLVHPNTDNPHDDHLLHALWLGERLALNGAVLPHTLDPDETPEDTTPNTAAAAGEAEIDD
jgi:aromatic ring-cleaving dioxygenase